MTEQHRSTPSAEPPSCADGPVGHAGACRPADARRAVVSDLPSGGKCISAVVPLT